MNFASPSLDMIRKRIVLTVPSHPPIKGLLLAPLLCLIQHIFRAKQVASPFYLQTSISCNHNCNHQGTAPHRNLPLSGQEEHTVQWGENC